MLGYHSLPHLSETRKETKKPLDSINHSTSEDSCKRRKKEYPQNFNIVRIGLYLTGVLGKYNSYDHMHLINRCAVHHNGGIPFLLTILCLYITIIIIFSRSHAIP